MSPADNCAPTRGKVEARGATKSIYSQSLTCHGAAGKAVAVWLYCIGGRTLRDTQAAFDRHPSWRAE